MNPDSRCGKLGVNLFESLQPGQCTNGPPRSLLRQPDFIKTLQVQPEFRTGTEEMGSGLFKTAHYQEMSQTQRSVAGNGPPPIQDFGDAISRNPQPPRQPRRANSQLAELLREMSPG